MFAGPRPKAVDSKNKSQSAGSSAVLSSAYPSLHHLLELALQCPVSFATTVAIVAAWLPTAWWRAQSRAQTSMLS